MIAELDKDATTVVAVKVETTFKLRGAKSTNTQAKKTSSIPNQAAKSHLRKMPLYVYIPYSRPLRISALLLSTPLLKSQLPISKPQNGTLQGATRLRHITTSCQCLDAMRAHQDRFPP